MKAKLPPNWMAEQIDDIPSAVAAQHSPHFYWSQGYDFKAPLSEDDAKKLRHKLAERYFQWTGQDLGIDLERERMNND